MDGTDFGLGFGVVDEEGSEELEQSELFIDEEEEMLNLDGIVGKNETNIITPKRNIIFS